MSAGYEEILIIAAIFFFASFIHGSIGIGFPLISTPLLVLFNDMESAILLTLIPTVLINIVSIKSEGSFLLVLRRYFPLAVCTMLGSVIGTEVLISSNTDIFKILLAVAIIIYLLADSKNIHMRWVADFPGLSMVVFGISAGLLGGLTNVMAPLLVIYSLESRHSRAELIQAANLCFLLGKLVQLSTFSIHHKIAFNELAISVLMLIVVACSLYLAIRFGKKTVTKLHKNILKGLLFVLAIMLCLQAIIQT